MTTLRKNTEGLEIATDLTSWYGFLAYLTGDLTTSWACDNYLDITVLSLINADVRTPLPPADSDGPGYDLSPLNNRFNNSLVNPSARAEGLKYQKSYLHDASNVEALRNFLKDILADDSYEPWITWHIEKEWPEHIRRCKGLTEKGYEDLVTVLVPELTTKDIIAINDRAFKNSDSFSAACNEIDRRLFTADFLRRGLYYRRVTELMGRQQVLHQARRLPISTSSGGVQNLVLGFKPFLLSEIIRMHSANATTRSAQVATWIECVDKARIALSQYSGVQSVENFSADQKTLDSDVDVVVRISKQLSFSTTQKEVNMIAERIGVAIGGVIGAAAGLVVDPIGTAVATLVSGGIGGYLGHELGKSFENNMIKISGDTETKARKLASAGPGMVRSSLLLNTR